MYSAPIRTYLVDDHLSLLQLLALRINAATDLTLVGTAIDAETALREIPPASPDVVVLDVELPGRGAFDLAADITTGERPPKLVFFTGFLFTAGPKWLGVPGPDARAVLPAVALQALAWPLWLAGVHLSANLAIAALLLAGTGQALVTLRFARLLRASPAEDTAHARVIAIGWAIGVGRSGAVIGPTMGGYLMVAKVPLFGLFLVYCFPLLLCALCALLVHRNAARTAD